MRRVLLLEPTVRAECLTTEVFWQIRLSLPFIAGALAEAGFSSRIFCEELVDFPSRYDAFVREYDVAALSVTINTVERALAVAGELRRRRPAMPIVFGGGIVGHVPEVLLEGGDYVLVGRGEVGLPRLLTTLRDGRPLDEVPGLCRRDAEGRLHVNPPSDESTDHPCDYGAIEGYGGMSERRNVFGLRKPPLHSLVFSTGCVNKCRFCMTERRYRTRPVDHVMADLRQILERHRSFFAPRIMLVDDCPFGDRQTFKELLRALAEVRRRTTFSLSLQFHVKPLSDDPELVDLLVAAGTTMLLLGFETVSDESLASQNKHTTVADNVAAIEACRRAGIIPYGYFVVGFETDTPAVVRSVFDFVVEKRLVGQVLPVGITSAGTAATGTDSSMPSLDPYSFGATVFVSHRHPTMAPADLQRLLNEGYERIFALGRVWQVPTINEKAIQFGYWKAHRHWRPRLAAHVERLAALPPQP